MGGLGVDEMRLYKTKIVLGKGAQFGKVFNSV